MPKFAANLSYLFSEVPFPERFARAAAAGFRAVEFMFPYDYAPEQVAGWLRTNGLELVLFNLPPGDWAAGERGLVCLRGREGEFAASVETAARYARVLGCRQVHAMSGLRPEREAEAATRARAIANLRHAATRLAADGIRLLIEPINSRIDMPGYWLDHPALAFALLDEIGHANLAIELDLYHAHVISGDAGQWLENRFGDIAHVQIADHPGRHEPGSGEIDYGHLLSRLDTLGYRGWVGCEYRPMTTTEAGLTWMRRWQ